MYFSFDVVMSELYLAHFIPQGDLYTGYYAHKITRKVFIKLCCLKLYLK